jgi:trigger factor
MGHMQEKNARVITVEDRPVKDKDISVIDFEGFVDGKAFEGGKAEKHELEIGSHTFIPGFEEQVIGMKKDEEKDIVVKFPDDYFSKDLAGKDATFKVKVEEIKEKKLPELDDEFAKDVSEFDTLEELKASIKDKKQKENDEKAKREIEEAAIQAVSNDTEIDIPSGMIETEINNMISDMEQQLSYQGISLDQYLKMVNKTRKDIEDGYKEQAQKNVKARLVLEAVIKAEKIEADQKDIDKKVKEMAEAYGRKEDELKNNEQFINYISETMKTEKAIDVIVKNAKIK